MCAINSWLDVWQLRFNYFYMGAKPTISLFYLGAVLGTKLGTRNL